MCSLGYGRNGDRCEQCPLGTFFGWPYHQNSNSGCITCPTGSTTRRIGRSSCGGYLMCLLFFFSGKQIKSNTLRLTNIRDASPVHFFLIFHLQFTKKNWRNNRLAPKFFSVDEHPLNPPLKSNVYLSCE